MPTSFVANGVGDECQKVGQIHPQTKTQTKTQTHHPHLHPPPNPPPLFRMHPPSPAPPPHLPPPLLLLSAPSRTALLTWFSSISSHRAMPWRKPFLPPASTPRALLARRAYEVWISEVMLQQTRVATVIAYWNRWMARWPTIEDLAAASEDEVVSLWQGLGYYSRARRLHEAARLVVTDEEMKGLLPREVGVLEARVPGVGRYTAGAIAAIVFGEAVAMVDGNVLRVLSRQLGLLADVKERGVVEALWEVAERLVKAAVADGEEEEEEGEAAGGSERPGIWGQALMELGSTVCTPKPKCVECPVTATCRAYQEGFAWVKGGKGLVDIEDLCTLCQPYGEAGDADADEEEDTAPDLTSQEAESHGKQPTTSAFFETNSAPNRAATTAALREIELEVIVDHARKFPWRKPKKQVREEEVVVCGIRRRSDGAYLVHQRPEKGLLAGMWELPSYTLPLENDRTIDARKEASRSYVRGGEVATVPWAFSHLKLTMHVHMFAYDDQGADQETNGPRTKWATIDELDEVSMGTGMRNCWELARGLGKAWMAYVPDSSYEAL
ncbi:DNA glycosylase [Cercophora newfieldiana]|uniref:Adenine DNA glycosylase n=1 Tax=Cercophora newfieldiana TaxID=92897 RepID=A0AA39YAX3_9PEZI|nr:DNA glycosylase [Cercophora newfieldiana]